MKILSLVFGLVFALSAQADFSFNCVLNEEFNDGNYELVSVGVTKESSFPAEAYARILSDEGKQWDETMDLDQDRFEVGQYVSVPKHNAPGNNNAITINLDVGAFAQNPRAQVRATVDLRLSGTLGVDVKGVPAICTYTGPLK